MQMKGHIMLQRKRSKLTLLVLCVAALFLLTIVNAQDPQSTPTPKSDRDKCLTDKDHDACKKYYRSACLNKDAEACKSYAKELIVDCGSQPDANTPPEKNHEYLVCARKAQCWADRSISIMQWNETCKSNPDSQQCKEFADRFITAKACDNPPSTIF